MANRILDNLIGDQRLRPTHVQAQDLSERLHLTVILTPSSALLSLRTSSFSRTPSGEAQSSRILPLGRISVDGFSSSRRPAASPKAPVLLIRAGLAPTLLLPIASDGTQPLAGAEGIYSTGEPVFRSPHSTHISLFYQGDLGLHPKSLKPKILDIFFLLNYLTKTQEKLKKKKKNRRKCYQNFSLTFFSTTAFFLSAVYFHDLPFHIGVPWRSHLRVSISHIFGSQHENCLFDIFIHW